MSLCPLCGKRKGRRACPAKGEAICPQCCGSKRRVEIDCPSDCAYLDGAHAGAWEGRETERRRDARRLAPHVQALTQEQAELFFLALVGIRALRDRHRGLTDALLGQAITALRKTVETRGHGILYEHPPDDLRALGLKDEVSGIFEAENAEGRKVMPDDRDLGPVLVALEAALAAAARETAGATVLLDTVSRVVGERAAPEPPPERRLILEP